MTDSSTMAGLSSRPYLSFGQQRMIYLALSYALCGALPTAMSQTVGCPRPTPGRRKSWAQLIRRVARSTTGLRECGGEMRVIAVILEPKVIRKILDHIRNSRSESLGGVGVSKKEGGSRGPPHAEPLAATS
jgi:hypothetical protein